MVALDGCFVKSFWALLRARPNWLSLHEQLTEMGFEIDASIDLYPKVRFAQSYGILNQGQVGVLLRINMEANQAKHELIFPSRL